MQGLFTTTGRFEADNAYELLNPSNTTMLAQVLAECDASLGGTDAASLIMELGYAATDDTTVGGARIAGGQAQRAPGQSILHCHVLGWQIIPAYEPALFRMRVFPRGAATATLVQLSVLRTAI